jgi:dynein heavy chain
VAEADLLDILSNGGVPESILHHVPKVYLCTRTFMLKEGERTPSDRPIAERLIADVGKETMYFEPPVPLEGKVEIYMQTLLDAIKVSLFENLKRSLARYQAMLRHEWLMFNNEETGDPADPAQIILLAVAVNYVAEVEDAYLEVGGGNANALVEYNAKQQDQLGELVKLVAGSLTGAERMRVMVCITMDAHGRDVVDRMYKEGCTEMTCFQWQSQLKHKYRVSPPHASFRDRDPALRGAGGERSEIQIADVVVPYDYEYLGNGFRLVITPLTDRIYVTCTQALNLCMGCAPAGPAGTGKTESTKDLANALAKCIYVFNCSPEMDYQGLGNIFKGLAASGSWGCFDEFNRLIPEVLSVCTVQFKAVCDACRALQARVTIEGDEVSLDATCGAFITMNPGYLGRSELPQGLKALFRPMTVMVPDLVLICENFLMASGYYEAKLLASKFYCLYNLLKELLSKQNHYEWGLRAVKAVLYVAGIFRREDPDMGEQELLMRALRDSNTPKIVAEDEVVFHGLLGDLFPGLSPPRKVLPERELAILKAYDHYQLHPDPLLTEKAVNLEELVGIRHCNFIMGPPGSGKTMCWKTCVHMRATMGDPTLIKDVSPKSVKTEELYGFISLATREWKDGMLSIMMRNLGVIPDEQAKWIMLDGDLDANWIESMNSVMDDNRMLTLASNERIPLKPYMRLIFEIRDLQHATPATASRAGVVYIPTEGGNQWKAILIAWLKYHKFLGVENAEEVRAHFQALFDEYVDKVLFWKKVNTESVIKVEDMNCTMALLQNIDGLMTTKNLAELEQIDILFTFCAVWAFGSQLTIAADGTDYRKMFSDWWRGEFKTVKIPARDTVFDYWLDPDAGSLDQWTKSPFFYSLEYDSQKTPMSTVTVPTPETAGVTFWMEMLVKMQKCVILCGSAGTGKTQMMNGLLGKMEQEAPDDWTSQPINFNFYTTSLICFDTMSAPLEKKTGTNYGPPGNKRIIYFIDDVNLPELDKYNTQSAIELVRQILEYEHGWDVIKMGFKAIWKSQPVFAMNPSVNPNQPNPRLLRNCTCFAIGLPGPTSLLTIYSTFLDGHLRTFAPEIKTMTNAIIKCALGLHAQVSMSFRKTAANFHYEFNVRHIANVFQGLLVAQAEQFSEPEKFAVLWLHESERVYCDRLVSPEDQEKYNALAQAAFKKGFGSYNITKYFTKTGADPLVYCHFCENIQDKMYDQIQSLPQLSGILLDALKEYNETNAVMDLVLFADAMKHVARIVRIILNDGGHALLVGVGGSGKQSLTRLSSFICGYDVYQIVISGTYSINDLKEDLKVMYTRAGVKDTGVTFLLTDGQIVNERFLIFINDLLATGIIPDLFAVDEMDACINAMAPLCKAAGIVPDRKNSLEMFYGQIKKNLHVVLAFSPVGDTMRNRALKFPAITGSTVIDWFQPWPVDALFDVGQRFTADIELGTARPAVEKFLPYSFALIGEEAKRYQAMDRRYVYTTPKSYLEFLKLYGMMLNDKRGKAEIAISRLESGLLKLKETGESVAQLKIDLAIMVADATEKAATADGIAEVVGREKAIVEDETAKAAIEEADVTKIQVEVSAFAADTAADLAAAEPAVEAAMAALAGLDPKDISAAKGMGTPPPGVSEVFESTMCLLGGIVPAIKCDKKGKPSDLKGGLGSGWGAAKKILMGDIKQYIAWLEGLKENIDTGKINPKNFENVKEYLAQDFFKPEIIMTKNSAAAGLCGFVINIVIYYNIVVTVEPKRIALAAANAELEAANTKLAIVLGVVAELQAKLAKLTKEFNEANDVKQNALAAVAKGQLKLSLATRLTNALAAENERWGVNVVQMRIDKELLIGDVLISAAFISYIGPFTKPFRDKMVNQDLVPWLNKALRAAVGEDGLLPMSEVVDPLAILTTASQIAMWNSDGLPADRVSSENGCIVSSSARWPLAIDPQLQGIVWLRNMESAPERNLQVVRLSQKDMLGKVEKALERGWTIIIENLGETIDAVLFPIIQRATIKRGSKQYIKLGDSEVEYSADFRLYLHTKLSNPHYPPELHAECGLINFTVTILGLEDQLLGLVLGKERPDLAELSVELVAQQNGFLVKKAALESDILSRLAAAEGDITEDIELIENLEYSKKVATEIAIKEEIALETQTKIKVTSEKYRPVANRCALIFFMMGELVKIHSYYIYSLAAFTEVFYRGIDVVSDPIEFEEVDVEEDEAEEEDEPAEAETPAEDGEEGGGDDADPEGGEEDDAEAEAPKPREKKKKRIYHITELSDEEMATRRLTLIDSITFIVFDFLRSGAFERHKLTLAALLVLQIAVNDGWYSAEEVSYLVEGKVAGDPGNMGPVYDWLDEAVWSKVKALEGLPHFKGLGDAMQADTDDWRAWFDLPSPELAKVPGEFDKSLSPFAKVTLLRSMRPDRVPVALGSWIASRMDNRFIQQEKFDMAKCFSETTPQTPVFFVLFAGVDPTPWVEDLGKSIGISEEFGTFRNISMGQGQEKPAEAVVELFAQQGGWVMLQNLHLMQTWVVALERLLEVVSEGTNETFRCFISAEAPSMDWMKNMPESLMQSCIKIANEAPADIKSNLARSWSEFNQDRFDEMDECGRTDQFKACLLSLCYFHSVMLGRIQFGMAGFSRKYGFNTGDLTICAQVLTNYLKIGDPNQEFEVQWSDLRYIFGQIMYGGHITDFFDRRVDETYLEVLFKPELFSGMVFLYKFVSPDPGPLDYAAYLDHIENGMPAESPMLFGMHPNAEIGNLSELTNTLFDTVQVLSGGGSGGGGGGAGGGLRDMMNDLLERLPDKFEMVILNRNAEEVKWGPTGPYVVVALQEAERMNKLLGVMGKDISDLDKALKGQLNMTDALTDLTVALGISQWPGRNPFDLCGWEKNAWPSNKKLLPQFKDLIARVEFFNEWVDSEGMAPPFSLWLSALFNPMGFLTAIKQVTCRATKAALDKLTLETHMTSWMDPTSATYYPDAGFFCHGFYIEGARWEQKPDYDNAPGPYQVGENPSTGCAGVIMESRLKELLPALPIIYVRAIPVLDSWLPSDAGYLRQDPTLYEAPVYFTNKRGSGVGGTFIFLASCRTTEPTWKWTLTGACMVLQTND